MEGGDHVELLIAGVLLCIAVLVTAARVLGVPYPIFLVIGGLGLGFVPGIPHVELDPDLVLLIFLPPLLYSAAFFTSLRDLRHNVRPISLLSIGLVLATCATVAVVAHALVPGMSWAAAFVLGAVVSPTDPVAATAIAGRLGLPRRVVAVVEGESLINDATAITAYRVALAAVLTGSFSAWEAGGRFVLGAIGGVAIGLAVGWVVAWVRQRLDDPPVEITISLLTAYAAYLPAEELELSGVVAAVTVGLYMGSQTSRVTNARVRMQGDSAWQILVFLLNSFLFLLIGLQLPTLLDQLDDAAIPLGDVLGWTLLVALTVVCVRLVWVPVFAVLPRELFPRVRERDPYPPRGHIPLIAWMGMRGAVSLAAALALPVALDDGSPFTERPIVLFMTFGVILFTLIVQGLTIPALVRLLRVEPDDGGAGHEENKARKLAAQAALDRLDELEGADWTNNESVERARGMHRYRVARFSARFADDDDGHYEDNSATYVRMARDVLQAQREALEDLQRRGVISMDVQRRVERDLDLEEGRLFDAG